MYEEGEKVGHTTEQKPLARRWRVQPKPELVRKWPRELAAQKSQPS